MARLGFLTIWLFLTMAASGQDKLQTFVTRRGGVLYEGTTPFRFLGLAAPNLFQNESELLPDSSNRFPDEFELRDSLETLRQIGARATRTFTLSIYDERDKLPAFITGPGPTYNEQAFQTLDRLLALCHEYDVRVIVPFLPASISVAGAASTSLRPSAASPGSSFSATPRSSRISKNSSATC